ncbi:MAG: biotin--[acetyl-CoA-carboxylase] ligase [Ruminiclostridium sp.]|jgi:BirA family biotin operon repressor/biotin-[acetyl-CoA-carboxylase] ligase|nr:biotin--[acetyl-CoA-carboxylase] ligase [Ruminiclostridium sp.]
MLVRDRVLEALEAHRGEYFSGEALAAELSVTRAAVWKAISQLREGGVPIDAAPHRGYRLPADSDMLTPQGIARYVTVSGLQVEVREEVSSTNNVLREQALSGAPEGRVLIARRQSAGRGRRDHSFFSPADSGLYMSFLLRPSISAQAALLLTTCAAVATAFAIEEVTGVPTQIKWVNDVFCRGKKVCGILTEGDVDLETGGMRYAVVGIGVNVYPPQGGFPPELDQAGAVFQARPTGALRCQLAGSLLNHFFTLYPQVQERSFFEAYRSRCLVLGQAVEVLEGGRVRPATVLDLNPDFTLRVREADGRERDLSSGEVRVRLSERNCKFL